MAQQEYRAVHVIGSLTIAGTAYPFDEELVDDTPVPFTNAGVSYHLEQLSFSPVGAIGLWIDSNGSPGQSLSAQLSVGVSGLLENAEINDRSSDVSFALADVLQDGSVKHAGILQLAAPWTPSVYVMDDPQPSISFGLGINNHSLASGVLLGFVPAFTVAPTWHIVHQSPVTMIFK